jgi:nucleoside phosphorylase
LLKQTKDLLTDWIEKGALAVDMESSAILGIASMEDVPAASLNCISDLPERGKGPFDMKEIDPNFLTGLDLTLIAALRSVTTWQN